MSDQRIRRGERFIIEGQIKLRRRNIRAQWPTDLNAAHRATACRATADIVDQLAKRNTERDFKQAAMFDISGKLDGHRPL